MTARTGWAEARKNISFNCHDLKVVAIDLICVNLRNLRLKILPLIFLLNYSASSAQEYKFKPIAEKFRDGKFDKSLKLAEEEIAKDGSEMLPFIYKSLSIYQGKDIKKIVAKYPNLLNSALSILTEAKPKAKKGDSIPSPFFQSFGTMQMESFQIMSRQIKKGNYTGAKQLIDAHYKLFDNSSQIFESYIYPNLSKVCTEQLLLKETKDKPELFKLIFAITETYTNSIFKSPKSIRNLYLLKKIQQNIIVNNNLLISKKVIEYSEKWNTFLMATFKGTCEELRNYFAYSILFPKGETLVNDTYSSNSVFKSQQDDMSSYLSKDYQFAEWNKPKYAMANTAKNASYLTKDEKTVLYVTNLSRMDPILFEKTFVKKYLELHPDEVGTYSKSLIGTLGKGILLEPILPDSVLSLAAKIHAINYGELGKEGHAGLYGDPDGRAKHFGYIGNGVGECCEYGRDLPEESVLALLVDKDVPGTGHRMALMSKEYVAVGISIQPHKQYGKNVVMDFTE